MIKKILVLMMIVLAMPARATFLSVPESDEPILDYRLNVMDFNQLKVINSVTVVYETRTDSAGWAVFRATPEQASALMFSYDKNRLSVMLADDRLIPEEMPEIHLYSSGLEKVENFGDSTVTVLNPAPVANLKINVVGNGTIVAEGIHVTNLTAAVTTGSGNLSLEGKAQKATYRNVGTGAVKAVGLEAAQVRCGLFGTGPIYCWPVDVLRVYGAGSGKVIYKGSPGKIYNRSLGVKSEQFK